MEAELESTKGIRRSSTRTESSIKTGSGLLYSFCMAALALIGVVLLHQFLLAGLSLLMGYDTRLTFGKVDSRPFANMYWSTNRVLLLYAFPPMVLVTGAAILIFRMLYFVERVNGRYLFGFWWVVFSLLFVSTQLSVSPIAQSFGKGEMYQGIPVVIRWYGAQLYWTVFFSVFAALLNILLGFLCYRLVIQLSPSRSVHKNPEGKFKILRRYYLFPLLLVFPFSILLSYPNPILFFCILFMHGLLWLPGFYLKSIAGYRFEGKMLKNEETSAGYGLLALVVVLVILIRVFLSGAKQTGEPEPAALNSTRTTIGRPATQLF